MKTKHLLSLVILALSTLSLRVHADCVPLPSGAVAWWRAEGNAQDSLGANHGANAGGVTFTAGKVGQAFNFTGAADSYIDVANSPALLPTSNKFTIEAWIKPDFTQANLLDSILDKRDGCDSANISYLFVVAKAGLPGYIPGEVILVMTITGTTTTSLGSGMTHLVPADDQFHHVAATYDGAFAKIYLDGELVGQMARTEPIHPSISPATIGRHGGSCSTRSVAAIDEVAFFDRALTADEIQAIYAADSSGKSTTDSDGDGTLDCTDLCPLDPLKLSPGACGCGIPDTDSDGDGVPDCIDLCPFDPLKTSPGTSGCGVVDADSDADGIPDCRDNCPSTPNPDQADADHNGIGDACEPCLNDHEPPTITCPQNVISANSVVTFSATAQDNCPGITVLCTPPSGASFPAGSTTVNCTATDAVGLMASCSFSVTITTGAACPHPQGYWKNNPTLWPAAALPMTLGSQNYSQSELLTLMSSSSTKDASLILARQLIAATLNIANGSDPSSLSDTIAQANAALGGYAGKLPYQVKPSSPSGQALVNLANRLASYNEGALTASCAP